ncbi:hypothetical protein CR513_06834, partial [Mucuna pruriens]
MPPWENNPALEDLILQFQQNVGGTTGQYDKPNAVGRFRNDSLPDDSESDRGRSRHDCVPLPFPNRAIVAKRSEIDEDLLKLFRKVEINMLLLDAIKHIPKYAKFLKELCVHKRKKMKGVVKTGEVLSSIVHHEDAKAGIQRILPKKYPDPSIFAVPCIIGGCTLTNFMLDLRSLINVMLALIYKSLNLRDLEPTRMEVQLANRSVVHPLGVLKDVLVQVDKLIFPADFYVLDVEDNAFEEGSALFWDNPLMIAKTKIDVHARTLLMDQQEVGSDLSQNESKQTQVESNFRHLSPLSDRVGHSTPSTQEKYPLPEHLKYAYLGDNQLFSVIIANNLSREQEKLLEVLRKHKKAIGWTLTNLSICMHKILLEEDARPVRQ